MLSFSYLIDKWKCWNLTLKLTPLYRQFVLRSNFLFILTKKNVDFTVILFFNRARPLINRSRRFLATPYGGGGATKLLNYRSVGWKLTSPVTVELLENCTTGLSRRGPAFGSRYLGRLYRYSSHFFRADCDGGQLCEQRARLRTRRVLRTLLFSASQVTFCVRDSKVWWHAWWQRILYVVWLSAAVVAVKL